MDFDAPTFGGAVKAVFLPHLPCFNLSFLRTYLFFIVRFHFRPLLTISILVFIFDRSYLNDLMILDCTFLVNQFNYDFKLS